MDLAVLSLPFAGAALSVTRNGEPVAHTIADGRIAFPALTLWAGDVLALAAPAPVTSDVARHRHAKLRRGDPRMDRRHFIGLSGSALALMGLSRAVLAAPAADIKATLNVFRPATDTDIQLTEAAMARFAQKFPNVTVSPQYVPTNPWGEYINQLMNGIGGSSSPDVVMMATEGVSTLGSRKILRDIMPSVDGDPSGKQLFDGIEPNLMNGLKYGDTLSYIPNEWNTVVTYYNTAAFEAAGVAAPPADWDWDKFLEIAKALTITDGAGNVTRYGYMIPGGQFALNPWFLNNGTDRLTPDGHEQCARSAFPRDAGIPACAHLRAQGVAHFRAQRAGRGAVHRRPGRDVRGHAWPHPRDDRRRPQDGGRAVLPKKTDPVAILGVGGFGITEAAANPELAWEFIKELTGHANSEALARLMRSLPPQREAATSPEYVAYPANSEIFYGSAPIARSIAQPPNFAEVEAITMRHIESYLTGNTEIAAASDALEAELRRAMSRVRGELSAPPNTCAPCRGAGPGGGVVPAAGLWAVPALRPDPRWPPWPLAALSRPLQLDRRFRRAR